MEWYWYSSLVYLASFIYHHIHSSPSQRSLTSQLIERPSDRRRDGHHSRVVQVRGDYQLGSTDGTVQQTTPRLHMVWMLTELSGRILYTINPIPTHAPHSPERKARSIHHQPDRAPSDIAHPNAICHLYALTCPRLLHVPIASAPPVSALDFPPCGFQRRAESGDG